MRELSLFSGAGGGLLGTHHLLGWNCVGYVEWDAKCCDVLDQRIADGLLPDADIWEMDIREFNRRIAPMYRGKVDVVTAGWPCPPVSLAGKGAGSDDERWLWPEVARCLRAVGARWFMGENVVGLRSANAGREFGEVLGDLAALGFSGPWDCIPASACGAYHERDRVWFVADNAGVDGAAHDLLDAGEEWEASLATRRLRGMAVAARGAAPHERLELEPELDRLVLRPANGVDRLRAAGNIQFPAVVATAWRLLTE